MSSPYFSHPIWASSAYLDKTGKSSSFSLEKNNDPQKKILESRPEKLRKFGITVLGGSLLLGSFALDRSLQKSIQHEKKGSLGNIFGDEAFGKKNTFIDYMGQPHVALGVAGLFYSGGTLTHSTKAKRTGVIAAEAQVISIPIMLALKVGFGRLRPGNLGDSDDFYPFRGFSKSKSSFPSGHTTTAFTLASVIAEEYDNFWVDSLSYGLATTVGFARIYQNQHWASDVTGGALLGIFIGKAVSRWEKKRGWSRRLYSNGTDVLYQQRF